jgi:hypothetical protein
MKRQNKPFAMRKRCVLISTPFPRLEDGFIDGVPAICKIVEMHGTVNVRYWVQFKNSNISNVEFFEVISKIYPGIDIQRISSKDDIFSVEVFDLLGKINNGVWVHENLAFADVVRRLSSDSEMIQSGSIFFGRSVIEFDDVSYRSSFSFISSNSMLDVVSIEEAIESIKMSAWCDSFRVPENIRPTAKCPIVYNANGGTICWFQKKGDSDRFEGRLAEIPNVTNFNRTYSDGRYIVTSDIGLSRFVDSFDTSNVFELVSWMSSNFWSKGCTSNVHRASFMSSIEAMIETLYEMDDVRASVGSRINSVRIPSKISLVALMHECLDLIPTKYYGNVVNLSDMDSLYRWRDGFMVVHPPLYEPWKFQQPILEFCYLKYALVFRGKDFIRSGSNISVDVSYDMMTFLRDINRDEFIQGYGKYREEFYDAIVYLQNIESVESNERMFLLSDLIRKLNKIKFTI